MPSEAPDLAQLQPVLPSPLEPVEDERFARHGVRLLLKRDDLIHPELPGNKWRKLSLNLREAAGRTVLTFGGAYSNHLRATAAAGRLLGFPTVGVVRGDELADRPLNPSLARCAADGMTLHFMDRATYRAKGDPEVLAGLLSAFGECCVIPEGGSNALAVQGCTELGRELRGRADVVAVACGTGGTLAGLAAGLAPAQRALGVPVLRGGFLGDAVRELQRETFGGPAGSWSLDERFHFGGYARTPPSLHAFADDFEQRHGLPVERIYVAKLLHALTELAGEGAFPPGTTVAAVVTAAPQRESGSSR
ncbi:pyridoxal-phosphate dependent enzyme [Streptomyces pulveraceus]|uniref:1-aminocyclopropane-1-carboxylate deaminase/D-cysteine desulfhydrase n=1 Tax=Streptomyces pulveraceus TaxID=68258 RepID=A0ABW1GAU9_9ACTN